ncbi:uncharacterized protein CMU_010810 [Cryptosporidium muris RN66]|uniref:Uncharacterized protein n=1 Tax=Cryptosporidium muris (strain RN66) TaxID=441375 RepID=B6AIU2_CRYMR|nr:uncharacterized protein CMU_010810 [Cryptosporidium muris RN66]EEA08133.1 hypothetical protein, conserved [Cryptosporidium muris RN66]|eukprot:XP_002142482.1 hypothetical protein [Cryptosporidium muris RN66]
MSNKLLDFNEDPFDVDSFQENFTSAPSMAQTDTNLNIIDGLDNKLEQNVDIHSMNVSGKNNYNEDLSYVANESLYNKLDEIKTNMEISLKSKFTYQSKQLYVLENRIENIERKLDEFINLFQNRLKYSVQQQAQSRLGFNSNQGNQLFSNNVKNSSLKSQTSTIGVNDEFINNRKNEEIIKINQRETEKRAEIDRLRKIEIERKRKEEEERRKIEEERCRQIEEFEKRSKLDQKRKEIMNSLFTTTNSNNATKDKKPSLFGDDPGNKLRNSLFDD